MTNPKMKQICDAWINIDSRDTKRRLHVALELLDFQLQASIAVDFAIHGIEQFRELAPYTWQQLGKDLTYVLDLLKKLRNAVEQEFAIDRVIVELEEWRRKHMKIVTVTEASRGAPMEFQTVQSVAFDIVLFRLTKFLTRDVRGMNSSERRFHTSSQVADDVRLEIYRFLTLKEGEDSRETVEAMRITQAELDWQLRRLQEFIN